MRPRAKGLFTGREGYLCKRVTLATGLLYSIPGRSQAVLENISSVVGTATTFDLSVSDLALEVSLFIP